MIMILPIAQVLLFQAGCLWTVVVPTTHQVSIDFTSPLFHYSGNWAQITAANDTQDADGGHMVTAVPSASATITYTFVNVYFVSALWPYQVATNYAIDGNPPIYVDMQDHSVAAGTGGEPPTKAAGVVGSWFSNATTNQSHTIHITVPPNQEFAIIDQFIFDVLDPPSTTTSITSISEITTSTSSSSSLPSTTTSSSPSTSSGSHGLSIQERHLIISMAILGTLLALIIIFLLWWFCIRRKDKITNSENINPHYHPVPTMAITPFTGTSGHYGQQQVPNTNYYPSSLTSLPSTFYTSQATSSTPPQSVPLLQPPITPLRAKHIPHNPPGHRYTPSMISDSPPMYDHGSTSPDSYLIPIGGWNDPTSVSITPASSLKAIGTNEKSGNYAPSSLRPPNTTPFSGSPEPEESVLSIAAIPGRTEVSSAAGDSVWDSGYPQPLRFVPIS